jgi:Flp pilus assembly protein TadG
MARTRSSTRKLWHRAADERGMMAVWAILFTILLLGFGSFAWESWGVFNTWREVSGRADAAAIAGASGLDEEVYRRSGRVVLDPDRAEELARRNLRAQPRDPSLVGATVDATPARVRVVVEGRARLFLIRLLLPRQGPLTVRAVGVAEPRRGSVP